MRKESKNGLEKTIAAYVHIIKEGL